MSATALAGLADQGTGGYFDSASYGSYAYGWKGGSDLIWMVDAYVAATDDGLIDTSKYSLTVDSTTANIGYVGTMLYTNNLTGNCILTTKSYISNRSSPVYTTPVTDYLDPYTVSRHFELPQTTAYSNINAPFFDSTRSTYLYNTDFGQRVIHIFNSEPHGLPTTISGSYVYQTTKEIIESDQFTADIVKDLKHCIGEQNLNYSVLNAISAKRPVNKNDFSTLYPDSSNSIVQWAVVATPLALNTANNNNDFGFWITKDKSVDTNSPDIDVLTVQEYGSITYAMDAYTQSWYNALSAEMLALPSYRRTLHTKYKIPNSYLDLGNGSHAVNPGMPVQNKSTYSDWGMLRKEYGYENYYKLADTAYINDEKWPEHCLGVTSPKNAYGDWHSNKDTYARYCGITIALSKMEETSPQIPVYYYVTPTPDNPVQTTPTSVSVDKPFIPNPPPGTAVDEVIIPDKLIGYSTSENPPGHYPTGYSVSQYIVPKNPDGTYPIKPKNPPYILVKCVAAVPVYYHTFTFTNTTGTSYSNVIDFLKDNPDVTESDAAENIVLQDSAPSLAATKSSTYTPKSNNSIVAIVSTSGSADGITWKQLMSQGEAGNRYGSY